jgi:predicted nucleic acid-binding protein
VIVLDASVLIAHLESTDAHHRRATELLVDAADDQLGVSPITMAEILVGPARTHQLDRVQALLDELGVIAVPLTDDSPARLANLRATTRLPLPDCCVLLAAETARTTLVTFDDRLANAAADLGLHVRSV